MQQFELNRYARQLKLSGFGKQGQEKLSAAKVLIVGCGALGCPSSIYLAAGGVGQITICDPDKVEETNLHRQILFDKSDIGLFKADIASEKLQDLNENCKIMAIKSQLNEQNCHEIIKSYDLIIDATDNYEARFLINKTCVEQKKPYVFGAVAGWQGQAAVLAGKPCLECFFKRPQSELELTCENNGILGALAGQIGALQASLAIKHLIGAKPEGKFFSINFEPDVLGSNNIFKTTKILPDKACNTCS